MTTSKRLAALVAGGTLVVGVLGTGVAMATSGTQSVHPGQAPGPAVVTGATTVSTDADNVQQGDQTTPDTTGPTEGSGNETESGTTDGPGGHADPAGNVDHQFQGEE